MHHGDTESTEEGNRKMLIYEELSHEIRGAAIEVPKLQRYPNEGRNHQIGHVARRQHSTFLRVLRASVVNPLPK